MLRELYIENLATIEKATIAFGGGLNVFTGETGAGKSILIGGINSILGQRVYKDIVRAGTEKAVVSAFFDNIPAEVEQILTDSGFDIDEHQLVLQREISADGRSVARIGGRVSTVGMLKEIGTRLVDIHGQHDTQILLSADSHRDILDSFGGYGEFLEAYQNNFKSFSQVSKKLKKMQLSEAEKQETLDMLNYQIEEIKALNLQRGEDAALEQELVAVRNASRIQEALSAALDCLDGDGEEVSGAVSLAERAQNEVDSVTDLIPQLAEVAHRLESAVIELDDIRGEISRFNSSTGESTERLAQMEERMMELNRVKRKYGMGIDELLNHLEECLQDILHYEDLDGIIEDLMESRREIGEGVKRQAKELSELRKQAAERLVEAVSDELRFLDMPNVRLAFDIKQDKIGINGMDIIEMLISVNKGEEPKPINKVASGGELSRIMLAIKNVLAETDSIPTMIFDEIDTGISGRAAQKVGIKLSEAAQKRQTLCVTHLAQIAAMADTHILIEKTSDDKRTYSNVKPLDFEGRKHELARIIDGDGQSETALASAEEMLKRRQEAGR